MGKDKDHKSTSKSYKDYVKKKIKKKVKKYKKEHSQSYDHKGSRVVEVNKGDAKRYGAMPVARPAQQPNHVFNSNRIMQLQNTVHALTRESLETEGKISELTQEITEKTEKLNDLKTNYIKRRNEFRGIQKQIDQQEDAIKKEKEEYEMKYRLQRTQDSLNITKALCDEKRNAEMLAAQMEQNAKLEELKANHTHREAMQKQKTDYHSKKLKAQTEHDQMMFDLETQVAEDKLAAENTKRKLNLHGKALKEGVASMMPARQEVATVALAGKTYLNEPLYINADGKTEISQSYYDKLDVHGKRLYKPKMRENRMATLVKEKNDIEQKVREYEVEKAKQDTLTSLAVATSQAKLQLAQIEGAAAKSKLAAEITEAVDNAKAQTHEVQTEAALAQQAAAGNQQLRQEDAKQRDAFIKNGHIQVIGPNAAQDARVTAAIYSPSDNIQDVAEYNAKLVEAREEAKRLMDEITKQEQQNEEFRTRLEASKNAVTQQERNEAAVNENLRKLRTVKTVKEAENVFNDAVRGILVADDEFKMVFEQLASNLDKAHADQDILRTAAANFHTKMLSYCYRADATGQIAAEFKRAYGDQDKWVADILYEGALRKSSTSPMKGNLAKLTEIHKEITEQRQTQELAFVRMQDIHSDMDRLERLAAEQNKMEAEIGAKLNFLNKKYDVPGHFRTGEHTISETYEALRQRVESLHWHTKNIVAGLGNLIGRYIDNPIMAETMSNLENNMLKLHHDSNLQDEILQTEAGSLWGQIQDMKGAFNQGIALPPPAQE